MFKLLQGELYRLLHKKSMYIYFGILAIAYAVLIYVRSGGFTSQSVVEDAVNYFYLLPALAGGFLFAAVYTDDLNSKNLSVLVGYGIDKTKVVITKFILMALVSVLVFMLAVIFHSVMYALLGWAPSAHDGLMLWAIALKYYLTTVAFAVLSGIVVYGLQRTTFAMVLYILLAFNVISGLFSMVLKSFAPTLTAYLMSGISDRIMLAVTSGGSVSMPIIEYALYVVIAGALSVLAFHKKEMEF